jgi:uncharacterized integral membrane protein (TIGR00697 family)
MKKFIFKSSLMDFSPILFSLLQFAIQPHYPPFGVSQGGGSSQFITCYHKNKKVSSGGGIFAPQGKTPSLSLGFYEGVRSSLFLPWTFPVLYATLGFRSSGRDGLEQRRGGRLLPALSKQGCRMIQSVQQAPRSFRCLDLVTAFFVAILIISNIASSAKIIDLGFSLFGIRLAFDGGTLLFPLSYVFGDILTEVYGFRASRRVIWTGFAALVLASLVLFTLRMLPGEAGWERYAGNLAYTAILGGVSSGGIVLASLAAYWVGEFSNSMVLSRLKVLMKGKFLWVRTIGSTLIGELLDSLVFVSIACLTGVFSWALFMNLTLTNYLFKCSVEALMTPVTYAAVFRLKKTEGLDVYDEGISFNPFGAAR